MKLNKEDWARFGRWMMVISGIVLISLALYGKEDIVSWLLRIWGGLFGIYCIYIAIYK